MRDSFRTRSAWVHRWVGFVVGLVLFAIFMSGSLAVFDTEIGRWMQPEITVAQPSLPTPRALGAAQQAIAAARENGLFVFLDLPSEREPALRVLHHDGHEFVGTAFDPVTGDEIVTRSTVGGDFFYNLHFTLRLGHDLGRIVVDGIGVALMVAIITGVVIHLRALLPDLLIFRPFASRARAWMDAHVLAGVLFLPFLFITAFTGVVVHSGAIFPDQSGPHGHHHARQPPPHTAFPPLGPIIRDAETRYGKGNVGFLLFNPRYISAVKSDGAGFLLTRDEARYSYRDGTFISAIHHGGGATTLGQTYRGLHFARWAPLPVRWLYFISGLGGAVLIGSGLILFLMQYRRLFASGLAFRLAEASAMAAITGFGLAAIGLLWANRLIPAEQTGRAELETTAFFGLWIMSLIHAACCCFSGRSVSGWRHQLAGICTLGALLPLIDYSTRAHPFSGSAPAVFLGVDLCAALLGLTCLFAYHRLGKTRTV